MGGVRRRQLMSGAGSGPDEVAGYTIPGNVKKGNTVEVERPGWIRYDAVFDAASTFTVGYYIALRQPTVLLDGNATTYTSDSNYGIMINCSAGNHVVYVSTKERLKASNNANVRFVGCKYLRLPYDAHEHAGTIGSNNMNQKADIIDVLTETVLYYIKAENNTTNNATVIRVPVGVKQKYADAGASNKVLNKMIEVNFKYTV